MTRKISNAIDDLVIEAINTGASRAEVAGELLIAASMAYDVGAMVSGVGMRPDGFVELARGAYNAAAKRLKTKAVP